MITKLRGSYSFCNLAERETQPRIHGTFSSSEWIFAAHTKRLAPNTGIPQKLAVVCNENACPARCPIGIAPPIIRRSPFTVHWSADSASWHGRPTVAWKVFHAFDLVDLARCGGSVAVTVPIVTLARPEELLAKSGVLGS
jgi:hypothetical protein